MNKPLFIVNGGTRSAVSDERRRSVRRAAEEGRRRSRVPAAAGRRRTTRRGGRRSRTHSSSSSPIIRVVRCPTRSAGRADRRAFRAARTGSSSIVSRPDRPDEPPLPDVNRMSDAVPSPDFGIRGSGARINRVVKGSNAEQIGLKSGDVVLDDQQSAGACRAPTSRTCCAAIRPGGRCCSPSTRGGESVRLTGRYAPTVLPGEADAMFPRQRESGRVDLRRTGNRVEATTQRRGGVHAAAVAGSVRSESRGHGRGERADGVRRDRSEGPPDAAQVGRPRQRSDDALRGGAEG